MSDYEKTKSLYDHGALQPHHIEKIFRENDPEDWTEDNGATHIMSSMKEHAPPEHVAAILRSGNDSAITDLVHYKNVDYGQLKHLSDTGSTEVKKAMLYRHDIPEEDFDKVANHFLDHEEDTSPITSLYGDKQFHPDTIEKILKHPEIDSHDKNKFLAHNHGVKPETLEHYGMHGTDLEKASVAQNLVTPKHVLAHLALHGDENVKQRVAYNYSTPHEALMKIPTDNEYTAHALVSNPNAKKELLQKLENHPVERVSRIAKNKLSRMQ